MGDARRGDPRRADRMGVLAAHGKLVLGRRLREHGEHRERRILPLRPPSVRRSQPARPQRDLLHLVAALRPPCGAVLLDGSADPPPERLADVPAAAHPHVQRDARLPRRHALGRVADRRRHPRLVLGLRPGGGGHDVPRRAPPARRAVSRRCAAARAHGLDVVRAAAPRHPLLRRRPRYRAGVPRRPLRHAAGRVAPAAGARRVPRPADRDGRPLRRLPPPLSAALRAAAVRGADDPAGGSARPPLGPRRGVEPGPLRRQRVSARLLLGRRKAIRIVPRRSCSRSPAPRVAVLAWRGGPGVRRAAVALASLSVGIYFAIALGRTWLLPLPRMAAQLRYHYVAAIPVVALLCMALQEIGRIALLRRVPRGPAAARGAGPVRAGAGRGPRSTSSSTPRRGSRSTRHSSASLVRSASFLPDRPPTSRTAPARR